MGHPARTIHVESIPCTSKACLRPSCIELNVLPHAIRGHLVWSWISWLYRFYRTLEGSRMTIFGVVIPKPLIHKRAMALITEKLVNACIVGFYWTNVNKYLGTARYLTLEFVPMCVNSKTDKITRMNTVLFDRSVQKIDPIAQVFCQNFVSLSQLCSTMIVFVQC